MFNYQFNSMSTIVKISVNRELFANDMMPIDKLFQSIERTCSRFRSDSELSLLNQQIGKEVEVSNDIFFILTEAIRFYKETAGVFNPGILDALEKSGYSKSIEYIRGQKLEIAEHPPVAVTILPFFLNKKKQTATFFSKIDLGGIAKGWVIDRAALLLENSGYGFINVGGDIRIFGSLPRPLNIGIENPFDVTKMISSLEVESGAIATSTSMKRKWRVNGKWQHHLIDPRTGSPAKSSIVSATVTAPTALEADVLAKTVLLLDEEKGRDLIAKKGSRAVLINRAGELWRGGA
ncbi:MAG TPA: FAD:protein FMN transferase [Neobacillus sp.]